MLYHSWIRGKRGNEASFFIEITKFLLASTRFEKKIIDNNEAQKNKYMPY
jgi:hypothetical protein